MRLNLIYKDDDPSIVGGLAFAEDRLYVARSLIPKEFESFFL